MNWQAYLDLIKYRWQSATLPEKWRIGCLLYVDLFYAGGKETPDPRVGADCSGIPCGVLSMIFPESPIRVTAKDLFENIFTLDVPPDETDKMDRIQAVFYETAKEVEHFGRKVPAGHIVHVAPVIGHWTLLDARQKLEIWTAANAQTFHARLGRQSYWRELNAKDLLLWTRSHRAILDPELAKLIGALE